MVCTVRGAVQAVAQVPPISADGAAARLPGSSCAGPDKAGWPIGNSLLDGGSSAAVSYHCSRSVRARSHAEPINMLADTPRNLRSFGLLMAIALLALSTLHVWRAGAERSWLLVSTLAVLSVVFSALAILAPQALRLLYKPWMAMGHILGLVMTTVLMTVIYFTLLVPFTLIRRRDPLRTRLGGSTYWEPHNNPEPTLERFRRAF